MREAIGGTWLTQLVITFMLVFVAFLALSINYSRAYKVKNEVMSIIEKKSGINQNSVNIASNYLRNTGYKEQGKCEKGMYGITINNNGGTYEAVKSDTNKKYSFCIGKNKSNQTNFPNAAFYDVELFFKFNLPVVGDIYTFHVDGQTKDISYPLDASNVCTKNDINDSQC